ncbi:MAG: four-helix bundle copper-binding protein [Firmicutes bacterium]|nr:four-helix bundle copper-binding protein [Bacillota bacterium]
MEAAIRRSQHPAGVGHRVGRGLRRGGEDQVGVNVRQALFLVITICDACAAECDRFQDQHCRACADECRRCADECRKMTAM